MTEENLRASRWCFTINNFSEEDKEQVIALQDQATALIAETEHCGEGEGTPHIQGYVSFSSKKYRSWVSRLLPRAHLIPAQGGWKSNWVYCSKEGSVFVEKGHKLTEQINPNRGNQDFLTMHGDMKVMTPQEFEESYPKFWVMHRERVLSVMIDHAMDSVDTWNGNLHDKNFWIFGAPGVGKSRWASSQGVYAEIMKKNFNKWWDGYNLLAHKIVIIDDYPCLPQGNVLAQHMKIWGDRYPFVGECKGSHQMIEPGRFFLIITSNYSIDDCFQTEEDKEAIHRRFNELEMTPENIISFLDTHSLRNILK